MKYKWQVAGWVKDFGVLLCFAWFIGGGVGVGAIIVSISGLKLHHVLYKLTILSIYLGPILIIILIPITRYLWNNKYRFETPIKKVRVPIKEDLRKT